MPDELAELLKSKFAQTSSILTIIYTAYSAKVIDVVPWAVSISFLIQAAASLIQYGW